MHEFLQPAGTVFTSNHTVEDITIDFTFAHWRVPWRTQIRWLLQEVWERGWGHLWSEGLWWRKQTVTPSV